MKQNKLQMLTLFLLLAYQFAMGQTEPSTQDGFVNKIFGGEEIDISEAPYQVLMKINGVDACGGVILS